jgi:hypothetical protein
MNRAIRWKYGLVFEIYRILFGVILLNLDFSF